MFALKKILLAYLYILCIINIQGQSPADCFFVDIKLDNEIEAHMLFDTGTSHTVIGDSITELLDSWKIPTLYDLSTPTPLVYKKINIPFVTTVAYGFYKYSKITFQNVTLNNEKVYLYNSNHKDFSSFRKRYPLMQGFLGWNLIKQYNWVLDVKNKNVTPYPLKDDVLKFVQSNKIKLNIPYVINNTGQPLLEIKINNKEKFRVLFDTGFNWEVEINKNIFLLPEEKVLVAKFDNALTESYVVLDSVIINDVELRNVRVKVSSEKCLLGVGFINFFDRVIMDNANQQILFLKEE